MVAMSDFSVHNVSVQMNAATTVVTEVLDPDSYDKGHRAGEEETLAALPIEKGEGEVSVEQKAWKDEAKNSATGKGAVALGGYNTAAGKCSMSVNYNNEVNAPNAFAANSGNMIPEEAEGAFVSGHHNEAKSIYQTIVGAYSEVEEDDSFVVGNGSSETQRSNAFKVKKSGDVVVPGNASVQGKVTAKGGVETEGNVVANKANVDGVNARNISATNNITATNTVTANKLTSKELEVKNKAAIGSLDTSGKNSDYGANTVEGSGSAALGGGNSVHGVLSAAIGRSNTIPEGLESVFVAGYKNTAAVSRQFVFGVYADPTAEDMMVVGNGNSAGRKNAFTVKRNGDAEVQGKLSVNTLSVLNNLDACDVLAYGLNASSYLKIGSTVITEAQLQKLLALIS